jgi:hypothetical protein
MEIIKAIARKLIMAVIRITAVLIGSALVIGGGVAMVSANDANWLPVAIIASAGIIFGIVLMAKAIIGKD